jgi:hypothetical protein
MHWTWQRSYAFVITFCVIAAVMIVAITADPFNFFPFKGKQGSPIGAADTGDHRVGLIIFEIDPHRCAEIKFDNLTGRFSEFRPCDSEMIGFDGDPMAPGTSDRLRSIHDSFAGNQ